MAERNGYLVIVETDINPNSSTFNQTREREVYDTDSCPLPNADYQLVDEYCEIDNDTNARTGWKILVYQDMNINSSTYLDTYEDRVQDETTCDVQTIDPAWEVISEACEVITYGSGKTGNSGYYIITYQDMNSLSPTYNETYEDKIYNTTVCPAPDITPDWFTLSQTCKIINIDGVIYGDGTANIVQIDINEYSPTYNQYQDVNEVSNTCEQTIGRTTIGGYDNAPDEFLVDGNWSARLELKVGNEITVINLDKDNIGKFVFNNLKDTQYKINRLSYWETPTSEEISLDKIYLNNVEYPVEVDDTSIDGKWLLNNTLNILPPK